MATYLITGVAGFIGSHLADALLMRGDSVGGKQNIVRGVDNFATGKRENIPRRVFNVACGQRHSLNGTFRILAALTNYTVPPIYEDPRPGDIRDSLADISAREAFGYRPLVGFEEGLSRTVDWCRAQLDPQQSNLQQVAPKRRATESAALLETSNATT